MTNADTDRLNRMAQRISPNMRAVRCVFGHGEPRCGCPWRLVYVDPTTGGYTTMMHLGATIPKASLTLRGILFGIAEATKEN